MVINGNFDTGTFQSWRTIGNNSIDTSAFGVSLSGNPEAEIENNASSTGNAVDASDLEEFLNLNPGDLDSELGNVTEGSVIKQTITTNPGDEIQYTVKFLTNESLDSTFNDTAFVSFTADGFSTQVIELFDTSDVIFSSPSPDYARESNEVTFTVISNVDGELTMGFGVVDSQDTIVDSALYVDDVTLIPGLMITLDIEEVEFPTLDESNLPVISSNGSDMTSVGGNISLTTDFLISGIEGIEEIDRMETELI